ncbi:uncharacterized protein LOC123319214 [Coccinella septempunctata]|uniref:uncharacterized protein LOC123319214 n=1 Tax=Coccinella septempunctata TaxID=41139 RepID=UPI001D065A8D|nr:uncharacterized protein LOC123319214 [Coccinella septempunctata]
MLDFVTTEMADFEANLWSFSRFLMVLTVISSAYGISITINSEPKETVTIASKEETTPVSKLSNSSESDTLSQPERHKRLLPYLNYYVAQNKTYYSPNAGKPRRYHVYVQNSPGSDAQNDYFPEDKNIYTPFLETNALPGPFVPMVPRNPQKNIKIHYIRLQSPPQTQKPPIDFSSIYGKLYELKSKQQLRQPVQVENYENPLKYKSRPLPQPTSYKYHNSNTVVQTYTPTNIDIPQPSSSEEYTNHPNPEISVSTYRNELKHIQKPYFPKQVVIDIPQNTYIQRPKQKQNIYRKPIIVIQKPPIYYDENKDKPHSKPVIYVQARPRQNFKPYSAPVVEENYVAQKYLNYPKYEEVTTVAPPKPQIFQPDYYQYEPEYPIRPITSTPLPTSTGGIYIEQNHLSHEDPRSLSVLLKKLQDANALPHTFTVDNIDNSIKTLVKILNSLKKHRTSFKPIVVAEENEEYSSSSEEITPESPHVVEVIQPPLDPEVISHPDTEEGGTPGTAGKDYPALSSIPPTSFNCKTQRYKGFFGDPDTNCQVWHYCDLNGGQASFLCPNGTIFSQVALTCDWWYNVKCSSTPQLYVLNERLYKYILPFVPKFPEDYSGPLVDKYLAIKFMEMEEKMKKERKGKDKNEEDSSSEETTNETVTATTEKAV